MTAPTPTPPAPAAAAEAAWDTYLGAYASLTAAARGAYSRLRAARGASARARAFAESLEDVAEAVHLAAHAAAVVVNNRPPRRPRRPPCRGISQEIPT